MTSTSDRTRNALLDEAMQVAEQAAAQAGVWVSCVTDLATMRTVAEVCRTIWQSPDGSGPITSELLRALTHAGNYVAAAFRGDEVVGASVAFLGRGHAGLHSHLTGVLPAAQGRSVGSALKWHQRAWAVRHGLESISWTFDPLLLRNAAFNLNRLGTRGVEYLVDFYGQLQDTQNSGAASDRMMAMWHVGAMHVRDAGRGRRIQLSAEDLLRAGAVHGLCRDPDGEPRIVPVDGVGPVVLVQLPDGIQALRRSAPELADRWRMTTRAVLHPLFEAGYAATHLTKEGQYVLESRPAT